MQAKSWLLTTALGGFAILGCGGDGGSGVPSSKKVADLSASERTSLCESFGAKFKKIDAAFIKVDCTDEGLDSEDDCEEARTTCIDDAEPEAEFECEDEPEEAIGGDDCDVTVKQFDACIDALVTMTEKLAKAYTCEDAEDVEEPDIPKACTDLQEDCPVIEALAGSEDDDA